MCYFAVKFDTVSDRTHLSIYWTEAVMTSRRAVNLHSFLRNGQEPWVTRFRITSSEAQDLRTQIPIQLGRERYSRPGASQPSRPPPRLRMLVAVCTFCCVMMGHRI
jgi:hypothetical protein